MSIRLPTTDLSGKIAGNAGTVTWTGQHISPALATQMYGAGTAIQVYNESGCGLNITFQGDTSSSFIPAGGWRVFTVGPDIQQYTWTVDYVLPNAPVNHLITIWYAPGEQVDETGFLGNSPIGVSAVPVSVSQVINDGNPLVTTVLEATPAGGSSSARINNDGSGYLGGAAITFDATGNFKCGSSGDSSSTATPALQLASNGTVLDIYNNPGDANWSWVPQSSGGTARGGALYGLSAANALTVSLIWNGNGVVTNVSNQPLSGNMGVAGIVAQIIRQHVTSTTFANVLSFTPLATGVYRVSAYILVNNGTSPQNIKLTCSWTDPDTGTGQTTGGYTDAGNLTILSGSNAVANGAYPVAIGTIVASTAGAISVAYQDPLNTPNDFVSALIERLA